MHERWNKVGVPAIVIAGILMMLVTAVCCNPEAEKPINPGIVPQAGSENPLEPGQVGLYDITGVPNKKKLAEAIFLNYPREGVSAKRKTDAVISFKADNAGKYLVVVAAYGKPDTKSKGKICVADYEIVVKGDVPPPPPPTGDVNMVLILEETADRTQEQAAVITSSDIREQVHRYNWSMRVIDDDVVDENGNRPELLAKWIDKATSLPWWFLITDEGEAVVSEPLPKTPEAALETIRRYEP